MKQGRKRRREPILSASSIGSANELLVCADLLTRGMDIYKAVSPGAPYDLLAIFAGVIIRIEVTTRQGKCCIASAYEKKMRRRTVDMVAVVETLTSRITYMPEINHAFTLAKSNQRAETRPAPTGETDLPLVTRR